MSGRRIRRVRREGGEGVGGHFLYCVVGGREGRGDEEEGKEEKEGKEEEEEKEKGGGGYFLLK